MILSNYFYINGTKDLLFRKEENDFIFFDPYNLEFFKVDYIGAEMLFLVSQKTKFKDILNYFVNTYNLSFSFASDEVLSFFNNFPLLNIIYVNLVNLEFPIGAK